MVFSSDQTRQTVFQSAKDTMVEPLNMSDKRSHDSGDPKEMSCQDGTGVVGDAVHTGHNTRDSKKSEGQRSRLDLTWLW